MTAPTSVVLERLVASRLLRARANRMTLRFFYRMQAKSYLGLFIIFGIGIAYFWWVNLPPAAFMMQGALLGVLIRDYAIARAQKKLWPPQSKLIDWAKVEKVAAGEIVEST